MRNMLRAAALALSVAALFAVNATKAQAAPDVEVNDILHFSDAPGLGGGGEFAVQVNAGPLDQFRTFCVQIGESINFTSAFRVAGVSTFSVVAGSSPLTPQTAYLYTQFRAGTLAGYNYANVPPGARDLSATLLQDAIWGFEGEIPLNLANPFVILANASGWTDIGSVRIANLVYAFDDPSTTVDETKIHTQDVLVLVPEPASILAWSLIGGCFIVGHRIRRNRMIAG